MKTRTQKIVLSAMFAAIICIATMVLKIPLPLKGYINLGDALLIVASWCMPGWYAVGACAVGSAFADIFAGYAIYAPATFVIKGLMSYVLTLAGAKKCAMRSAAALAAELIMVLGYFAFESGIYGIAVSIPNIIPNLIQGIAGIVVGIIIMKIYEKNIKKGING